MTTYGTVPTITQGGDEEEQEQCDEELSFIDAGLKLTIILLCKTPYTLRLWLVFLLTMNFMSLCYLSEIEAKITLLVMICNVIFMIVIYKKYNYTKLLGLAHILWIGLIPYLIYHYNYIISYPTYYSEWLLILIIADTISTLLDIRDVWLWYYNNERDVISYSM